MRLDDHSRVTDLPWGGGYRSLFSRVGGLQKRARGADYRALRKSGARFGGAGQWLAAELDSVRDEWDQMVPARWDAVAFRFSVPAVTE